MYCTINLSFFVVVVPLSINVFSMKLHSFTAWVSNAEERRPKLRNLSTKVMQLWLTRNNRLVVLVQVQKQHWLTFVAGDSRSVLCLLYKVANDTWMI